VMGVKEKVDLLIIGGYVLAMDDEGTLVDGGGVAVAADKIVAVEKTSRLERKYVAEETIDASRKAVMPGLVDTYGHAGHGLIGGFHHPLHGWPAREIYWHRSTPEWWYAEAQLAATERLRFGTTTGASIIGSTPSRTDSPVFAYMNAEAYSRVGVRAVLGVGPPDVYVPHIESPWSGSFLEEGGWVRRGFSYDDALRNALKVVERWHMGSGGRVRVALHPPYLFGRQGSARRYGHDYTDEDAAVVLEKAEEMRAQADRHGVQIHTHFFEGAVDFALEHFGAEKVDELLGPDVVVAHGNGLTLREVEAVGRNRCSVATAPSTAEDVWYGYPPVVELLEAGANVTISTDGSAPRFSFDLWKDIVKAMWHQWMRHGDQRLIPVGKALRMVTIDAARALGMGGQVGSLEPGKHADIILVDLDKPHLTPQTFVPNQLVYYVNGNDVDTVIVDGETLMKGTEILSVDVTEVMETARREAEKSYECLDMEVWRKPGPGFWHGVRWEG